MGYCIRKNEGSKLEDMQPWWVYIVQCADRTYYTGISPDVDRRVRLHNEGKGAKYTAARRPVVIVYSEKLTDRSTASKREAAIKRLSRQEKERLIHEMA